MRGPHRDEGDEGEDVADDNENDSKKVQWLVRGDFRGADDGAQVRDLGFDEAPEFLRGLRRYFESEWLKAFHRGRQFQGSVDFRVHPSHDVRDGGEDEDTLLRVGSLVVTVDMWKLLDQTIELQQVSLEDAAVYLHRKDS